MMNRRRIGGNRRRMAEFCGFQPTRIGGESADAKHLTGAAPNGTLRKRSRDERSVTVIRTVARYAPLRLRAANSPHSLSNLPLSPPSANSKSNWRTFGGIGGIGATRSFQFPGQRVPGACRASSWRAP